MYCDSVKIEEENIAVFKIKCLSISFFNLVFFLRLTSLMGRRTRETTTKRLKEGEQSVNEK